MLVASSSFAPFGLVVTLGRRSLAGVGFFVLEVSFLGK